MTSGTVELHRAVVRGPVDDQVLVGALQRRDAV
jgi:hypothetical protein